MKRTLLAVVVLATLPISAADAAPKKKKPSTPQSARFAATITGTQVTTWSYRSPVNPDDPCDAPSRGDGSQTIRFTSNKGQRLQAFKNKLMFGGRLTVIPVLEGKATIDREGEYKVDYPSGCPGDFDGGGGGDTPQDCGRRTAPINLTVGYEPEPESDWDGLIPLTRPKKKMGLTGEMPQWSQPFENCPWWIGGSDDMPSEDKVLWSLEKFDGKKLFQKKRKSILISADRTYNHKADGFTGKTLITWNLRLRRLK